ncbi:MAG: glutathione S-transferase [Planctomycetota bacterium]|jgi:glutathione S-transferase
MTENDLILHHYDASPFTQKALRMLGIKGANWYSVEMPMILPKPDLVTLTGGYRGTPVLQIGADVYIDNQRIALELETRIPEPSLFPTGDRGMQMSFAQWSHAFFRAGLHMVIALQSKEWPEEFQADRRALFPDINFDTVAEDLPHARSQLRAHAELMNGLLDDGRLFLSGDSPSLADIHAFAIPWFTRASMPEVSDLLADFQHLLPWEERVANIGEGSRNSIDMRDAHDIARKSNSTSLPNIDPGDAQGLTEGQLVTIEPDDSKRGGVSGKVVIATANEIAIKHENEIVGEVVVHFPRIGYRVV